MKKNLLRPNNRIYKLIVCFIIWFLQTFVFAYQWINYYSFTIVVQGLGTKFYFKGHVLFISIYFALLIFFQRTYGSDDIVHLKGIEGIVAQLIPLAIVNTFGYFFISLLRNWTVDIAPILWVTILQLIISEISIYIGKRIHFKWFHPVSALFLYQSEEEKNKLGQLKLLDEVEIVDSMCIKEGVDKLQSISERGVRAIVTVKPENVELDNVIKEAYAHGLYIYIIPSVTDVLIKSSVPTHLLDVPILYINNQPISIEQQIIKRAMDICLSLLLLFPASIVIGILAVFVKMEDRGSVFYYQKRCTKNGRIFTIIKLRSMKVNAESDGVAKLALKNDSRITSIGKIMRKFRLDELPQLWNILKGDMSFVGPRPERPEMIEEYLKKEPEFIYRTKVKAGLTGYAQIYGKYNTSYQDKLKLDLFYIENYSVRLDIKLLLVTLKTIFRPESAEGVD